MGRLMNPNEFIGENIDRYNERATSNYTTLLESTPIFGTYFHQNHVFTTQDKGLENVEDDLGRDSPIKYDKIEKVPFYNSDGLNLQIEVGEMGLNTDIEFELTLLPNTIKPYPNDYFWLDCFGNRYLFKVFDYQEDMIKSKPFYRINCKLSKVQTEDSIREIEEQVNEEYTTIFNNIGTDNSCIIKTSVFKVIDKIDKLTDKLRNFYIKNFYDNIHNVLTYKVYTKDVSLYNMYLNKFIIDEEIFEIKQKQRDFYSSVKLVEYIPTDSEFDAAYEKTIYYALESQNSNQFMNRFYSWLDVSYPHAPWFRNNKDYKMLVFLDCDDDFPKKNSNIMEYLDKEFFGRIKLNIAYENENDYFMENFIIRYINKNNSLPNDEFLDRLNNNIWRRDLRSYVFIPIIIFILRSLIRNETINQL